MKFQQLSVALATVIGCSSAFAFDGTINITGQVLEQTCKVKESSKNLTVTLPNVGTASLNANGQTASTTPFTIELEGCKAADLKKVAVYFDASETLSSSGGRLKNTVTNGGASNVQIQLLRGDQTAIDLTKNTPTGQQALQFTQSTTNIKMTYYARYFATGTATAGNVTSKVNYTVVYN